MSYIPTPDELDELKDRIIDYLKENDLWLDCGIYVNDKRYSYDQSAPDEVRIEEEIYVEDYLDYYRHSGNLLAMYFEGPLYHLINGYAPTAKSDRFFEDFNGLLNEYGLYYEQGNAWDLSCYPI
jgi:hypothetical protein